MKGLFPYAFFFSAFLRWAIIVLPRTSTVYPDFGMCICIHSSSLFFLILFLQWGFWTSSIAGVLVYGLVEFLGLAVQSIFLRMMWSGRCDLFVMLISVVRMERIVGYSLGLGYRDIQIRGCLNRRHIHWQS
jgi:hypothetical protein